MVDVYTTPTKRKAMVPRLGDLSPEQKSKIYQEFGLWERGYTLGVLSMLTNTFIVLRYPQYFWCWHLVKAFIFLPWRFIRFFDRGYEWYLADFCYINTYFTVAFCSCAFVRTAFGVDTHTEAQNYWLIRALFAFANGALVLAVPMFGNKLVFHDVDNTASMYIHYSPAMMFWTLRWGGGWGTSLIEKTWPDMFHVCMDMQAGDAAVESWLNMLWYRDACTGTVKEFIMYPSMAWTMLWGVPYFLFVLLCARGWIEKKKKSTLYHDTVSADSMTGRCIRSFPECLWPALYMVVHFLWTSSTCLLSIVLWNSFILHTAFLLGILLIAIHNGSTFMFRVVAVRQAQEAVFRVAAEGSEYEEIPNRQLA